MTNATDKAQRNYVIRTLAFLGGYVAINIALMTGAFDDVSRPGAYALALALSAPVAGQIWATLACMRETDEFVGGLLARRFILAAGLVLVAFTAWGFLETFAGLPHAPGWLTYPAFWGFFGLVSPFVKTTR